MSEFTTKLFTGLPTSDEDWNQHLLQTHRGRTGATPLRFASLTTSDGQNSYQVLADLIVPEHTAADHIVHLLDLACGDGYLSELCLNKLGGTAQITGVDMSSEELEAAQRRLHGHDVTLLLERAQHLSLVDRSVDVVLCHLAFMLMLPVEPVVAEVARVLKPGGLFAAVVNRPESSDVIHTAARTEMGRFFRHAFPHMTASPLVGDPRVATQAGLEQLFSPERGYTGAVDIHDFALVVEASADDMWAFWRDTYIVGSLDPERKQELGSHLTQLFTEHEKVHGSLRMGFPMRRIATRTQGIHAA
jgi:SAM-dependent methyltransferase